MTWFSIRAKRTVIAAARFFGVLGRLLEMKRRWTIAKVLSTVAGPLVSSDTRGALRVQHLDRRIRRTGVYLARRVDAVDPADLIAATVDEVGQLLDALDIDHSMSLDESGVPVLLVDDADWPKLDTAPTMADVSWDLHVRTRTQPAVDRPFRFLRPGWLTTTIESADSFECFLARSSDNPQSLVGSQYSVTVRATRRWGRPPQTSWPVARSAPGDVTMAENIRTEQMPPFSVDAVFAWVDGDDPAWQRRRDETTGIVTDSTVDGSVDHRFKSRDELRYSLRSILLFAPWIRNIYIVTDDQRPAWLVDHPRVRVVDHREILPVDSLPTFNSHVIESALHQVPGLPEHYLYFNDDMLFGAPVRWFDFFTVDGTAKFFMSGARTPTPWVELKTIDYANLNAQRLLRERFGTEITNKIRHTPYAQRRSVHEWMTNEFPDEVKATRAATVRSETDQSFSAYLHHYVGRELGLCASSRIRSDYFDVGDADLGRRLRAQHERVDPVQVLCLNDAELDPRDTRGKDRAILEFLEAAYPFRAPWEVNSDGDQGPEQPRRKR